MRTPQLHLVREAVMREPDAGRHIHIRPRQLPPECLDRIDALADEHGIERDLARRIAAELHRRQDAEPSRPAEGREAARGRSSAGAPS